MVGFFKQRPQLGEKVDDPYHILVIVVVWSRNSLLVPNIGLDGGAINKEVHCVSMTSLSFDSVYRCV